MPVLAVVVGLAGGMTRDPRLEQERSTNVARPADATQVELPLMPIPLVTRILVAHDHPVVRSGLKRVVDGGGAAQAQAGAGAADALDVRICL